MSISRKILMAINEGVLQALSFDDELPDTLEITMHRINNSIVSDKLDKDLEKIFYSLKLQEMLPNPLSIDKDFIDTAMEWHEKYGATYNPHLANNAGDETFGSFTDFIEFCFICASTRIDNLNWIDTSEVRSMQKLFLQSKFNGDISEWDVSNVTDMSHMFASSEFTGENGGLSKWDVSNVTNMECMFKGSKFNLPIGNWDVSNVKDMTAMFMNTVFNLPIGNWDVSNVKYMNYMFNSSRFNLPIGNWDVSNVKNLSNMFFHSSFNQDVSNWKINGDHLSMFTWGFKTYLIDEKNLPILLLNELKQKNTKGN